MKKLVVLIFTILILVGCENKKVENPDNIKEQEERVVVAFLDRNLASIEIKNLSNEIEKIDGVKKVALRDKEEIKKEMIESSPTYEKILNNGKENPFHDELHITVIGDTSLVIEKVKTLEGIYSIKE